MLVAIVPASLSLILISYDVPSSRPNVICASSLPSTINDTLVSVALKSLTAVPGTDSYTKEPFFSSFVISLNVLTLYVSPQCSKSG